MSWIRGEFVIDSISQQSLAKARAQIVGQVRHNADLEEFSNMGEDIGNITPIYPPESCCKSLQSAEEDYIHNNSCPVCLNNMLSDTAQKRLDAFNARIDGLKASIVAEKERRAAKAPTRYLVVYCEYVG